MANPEFKFDFEAVNGMAFEEGAVVLFGQLEAHYNEFVNQPPRPLIFGARTEPATEAAAPKPDERIKSPVVVDKDTITPKTVTMKKFEIKPTDEGAILLGEDINGNKISDQLLSGYDELPYGPVVGGVNGRYNLKASK